MDRSQPRSHAFAASTCLLLAAVANRSLTGAAFLVAFGVWGAVVVATSSGNGGARQGIGSPGRWDSRRLGHGLWSAVAALAAIVTVAQARHVLDAIAFVEPVFVAWDAGSDPSPCSVGQHLRFAPFWCCTWQDCREGARCPQQNHSAWLSRTAINASTLTFHCPARSCCCKQRSWRAMSSGLTRGRRAGCSCCWASPRPTRRSTSSW